MLNEKMYLEYKDILENSEGDILDFRVYKGSAFAHLVKLAKEYERHAIGMDTFNGLDVPSPMDKVGKFCQYPKGYAKASPDLVRGAVHKACGGNAPYELYEGKVADIVANLCDRKFALAVIDLFHYYPTKSAIEYAFSKLADGGFIYVLNYNKGAASLASKAVDEFIYRESGNISLTVEEINSVKVCKITRSKNVFTEIIPPPPLNPSVIAENTQLDLFPTPIASITPSVTPSITPQLSSRKINYFTSEPIEIALVLKTGGTVYDHRYVNAMAANIKKMVTVDHKITVLTNDDKNFNYNVIDRTVPLTNKFYGWWSKIELFRPGIFSGHVFYVDLDTIIVKNIDHMLHYRPYFAGIRDLYTTNKLQTGIMSFDSRHNTHIYEYFETRYKNIKQKYLEGDAGYIRDKVYNYDYLQDEFPNEIVSYKAHCTDRGRKAFSLPESASIVCFHGEPRPHTISHPELTQHWKYYWN